VNAKIDIARILLEAKCLQFNVHRPYLYASGLSGPIYCDNRMILGDVVQRKHIIDAFLSAINESNLAIDVVAGIATAGIPYASWIAEAMKKPLVYVRPAPKDHGKRNAVEGMSVEGKNVLLIEDLVNQGESSAQACDQVKEAGGVVSALFCIVDYETPRSRELFSAKGIPVYSLTDFFTLLNVAQSSGKISHADSMKVMEWHKNPQQWKA
jgi:orotate phosphoribosyltransferase